MKYEQCTIEHTDALQKWCYDIVFFVHSRRCLITLIRLPECLFGICTVSVMRDHLPWVCIKGKIGDISSLSNKLHVC